MESGTRLGPYGIQEQLGAGGLGEVYPAQDARLGRKVAIKVSSSGMPPSDVDRQGRFIARSHRGGEDAQSRAPDRVNVRLNWFQELLRLVPRDR